MKRVASLLSAVLLLGGCASMDAMNPVNWFSSSKPRYQPLPALNAKVAVVPEWSFSVGDAGAAVFSPAIVGDVVFAASRAGALVRSEAGKEVWRVKAETRLSGGVGSDGRLVVVANQEGVVFAHHANDGSLAWKAAVSSEVLAAPLVLGPLVIVRSNDHRIFAFDASNGERKWVYQRGVPALTLRSDAGARFAGGMIFAGYPGGRVVAIHPEKGVAVWEGAVAQPKGASELERVVDVTGFPAFDGGDMCAVAYQGRLACFDLTRNGLVRWHVDASSVNSPAMDGRRVYLADDRGVIVGYSRVDGQQLWRQDVLRGRQLSNPILAAGHVVVADNEGVVHVLDARNGDLIGRQSTDGKQIAAALQSTGENRWVLQTRAGRVMQMRIQ